MKMIDKLCWVGFLICATLVVCGIKFHESPASMPMLIAGYAFGFPLLIYPLAVFAKWSEDRKRKKE